MKSQFLRKITSHPESGVKEKVNHFFSHPLLHPLYCLLFLFSAQIKQVSLSPCPFFLLFLFLFFKHMLCKSVFYIGPFPNFFLSQDMTGWVGIHNTNLQLTKGLFSLTRGLWGTENGEQGEDRGEEGKGPKLYYNHALL